MTDPERILDRPPSELAATLLRAGTDEAPSSRSMQRTLSALGVGATALGTAGSAGAFGAAKVAASLTLATLTKWAGVGIAGGIVVAAAAHGFDRPAAHQVPAPRASAALVLRAPAPAAVAPAPPAKEEALLPAPAPVPALAQRRPQASPARAEELEAPLAAEVAFVDRGRAAFQRGELGAALAALASYEREFPEPRLLPEVLYLRMETSSRRGDLERATELGRRILRDYPRSPHAARARALVGVP